MNNIPPFIANSDDDMHCVNAVFRMVLKHFLNEDLTWEQIDTVTKTIPGKGVWTIPGDIMLAKKGIRVLNIELVDYELLLKEGIGYLRKTFGEQTADYYIHRTNIENLLPDIPKFLQTVRHETRRANVDEIISCVRMGAMVGAEVNAGALNNTPRFSLHYVLVYDFDGTSLHLHDPGLPPIPSRKISIAEFEKCFTYPGGNRGIEMFNRAI